MTDLIKVELGEEVDGPGKDAGRRHAKWHWMIAELSLSGYSRQPLLAACRAIKRMGGATDTQRMALYWPGKMQPSMVCSVGWGAAHTVDETTLRFTRWKPYPGREFVRDTADLVVEVSNNTIT